MLFHLKYKPSTFYSNFLIPMTVRNKNSRSGILIVGGGGGGAVGSGLSSIDKSGELEEAHYTANSSSNFYISSAQQHEFNAADALRALKEDIEQEIVDSGAQVNTSERINDVSFYIKYSDEDIKGNIKVTGAYNSGNFNVITDIEEASRSEKQPFIKRPDTTYQPEGNFYVVAFKQDDADARMFYEKGNDAAAESDERRRQIYLANKARGVETPEIREQAVMYIWNPMPLPLRQRFQERTGKDFTNFTEYDDYGTVYFLNELALLMYREAGEDFEILKIITADEISKTPLNPNFRVYYLPK